MSDNRIGDIIANYSNKMKGLELLENQSTVGSLSENDQFSLDKMEQFWLNSRNICESTITGNEAFPGEILGLKSENVILSDSILDLVVEYYTVTYKMYNFRKLANQVAHNSITIRVNRDVDLCSFLSYVHTSVYDLISFAI